METIFGVAAALAPDEDEESTELLEQLRKAFSVGDWDQELLIVYSEEDKRRLSQWLDEHDLLETVLELYAVPEGAHCSRLADDYGFYSENGRFYFYAEQTAVFTTEEKNTPDTEAALLQMKGHILCRVQRETEIHYYIGAQHRELIQRIADVYGAAIRFLSP